MIRGSATYLQVNFLVMVQKPSHSSPRAIFQCPRRKTLFGETPNTTRETRMLPRHTSLRPLIVGESA